MNKLLKILLCLSILATCTLSVFAEEEVETLQTKKDYYPMACEAFEVSYINNQGGFDKVACYSNFEDANKRMKELGGDHVVRYVHSYSPSKIVSMISGRVYSYPGRSGEYTMDIYAKHPDEAKYKTTYLTNHYEMFYLDTTLVMTNDSKKGLGYITIIHNGMRGYTDLEYTDLVPSKFLDKGMPIYLGGKDKTSENEQPFKVIPKYSYYSVEKNGNYTDLVFHAYRAYSNKSNYEPLSYTYHIDKAPSGLKSGVKYYTANGYEFYSDVHLKNKVLEYYPYYQFLPFRTTSTLKGSDLDKAFKSIKGNVDSKLKNQGQSFIDAQNIYGVNALLLYSMGAHESAWGTSNYALNRNNLFGWNAVDSNPDNASYFKSVADCVNQMAGLNLRGYLDIDDYRFFSLSLGNKGSGFNVKYASDPYWGISIASTAYSIDKAVNNYDGNLSDHNDQKLVKVTTYNAKAYKKADVNSGYYYKTGFGSDYQENYITAVIDNKNGFIKSQSANPISNGKYINMDTDGLVKYDSQQSVVYFDKKDVKGINGYEINNSKPESNKGRVFISLDEVKFDVNSTMLNIKGFALKTLQNYSDLSKLSSEFIVYELQSGKEILNKPLTNFQYDGLHFNDGYDYKYAGIKGEIDLSKLPKGEYGFKLRVTNGDYSFENDLYSRNPDHYFNAYEKNNVNYILSTSNVYRNRFELKIENKLFDYTKVKKPTYRDTVASFNKMELKDNKLYFDGLAYMRNVNHGKDDKVDINLYLNNGQKLIDLKAKTLASKLDYTSILKSKYDLSNISVEVSYDLCALEPGTYDMMVEISADKYYDIINLTDIQNHEFDEMKIGNKTIDIVVNKDRHKVQLVVE